MKTFKCNCKDNQILFFESSHCLACGKTVGIDDNFNLVEPYEFNDTTGLYYKTSAPDVPYQKCDNNAHYKACNGMVDINSFVPAPDTEEVLCFACRFNETIPDLSINQHIPLWTKMETAKRRALYTLKALSLPLNNLSQDAEGGLSFDFITDRSVNDHFVTKLAGQENVFTGHNCGHITINLAEADDVARSQTKHAMGERYRTLLGHFRHELGHYYFDQLIANSPHKHALCKQYFGDDSLDYQQAIDAHYKNGAPANWHENYISEYATMHPFEDWAETWAHYMHIIDTLETAKNFSITGSTLGNEFEVEDTDELRLPQNSYYFNSQTSISVMLDSWMEFSIILNSLNRSMGLADAYPFVLTQAVRTKLSFVHHAIHNRLNLMPDLNTTAEDT
ncbi:MULTISPECIES: zinc-binding metallopeptidase family protein [unclassified Pseudoalteromonas]|uniref:zinc-binding metallopeptidase family protein n=1 Tax=unclassified Pseudoalteromonas TaxID=194690 RepID=UPI0015FF3D7E|nr:MULTISPECIES: putative zinc-binding metallopeptidase [unclassified Pseudoalteromonas]MBB1332380.1 putative zinc-binding metallopeptidase [Pseudoalteromonas sp. SR41-6]MBB1341030.1 putative zinc-binding metallopeptidase [Pseudoalteromonas sp. SR45-6]MBB1433021.1 putative zinc-binding metallopeptidase [Pseudoalteromonas sp. SG43-6]MBB1457740.1 putative zinc-binding metallopeptidase [Pseudoalteromonas sp. SG41-8]MBB1478110.1 putative zinc-binding metallopeptidase [Pseudoalteromonas sp. SG41-2]